MREEPKKKLKISPSACSEGFSGVLYNLAHVRDYICRGGNRLAHVGDYIYK